jgi:hypothetical protein
MDVAKNTAGGREQEKRISSAQASRDLLGRFSYCPNSSEISVNRHRENREAIAAKLLLNLLGA